MNRYEEEFNNIGLNMLMSMISMERRRADTLRGSEKVVMEEGLAVLYDLFGKQIILRVELELKLNSIKISSEMEGESDYENIIKKEIDRLNFHKTSRINKCIEDMIKEWIKGILINKQKLINLSGSEKFIIKDNEIKTWCRNLAIFIFTMKELQ